MKICVVCQYYHPEPFKITQICEDLVSLGHSVHVLTGLPNYPAGTIPDEYRHGKRREETLGGVEVTRVGEIPRGRGKLALLLNYVSFAVTGSLKALALPANFDSIFVYQLSPVSMALPALVMKKRIKRPIFLYCLDLWPESMKALAPDERSIAFRLTKILSGRIYRSCDVIAVSSPTFGEYLQSVHGVDHERVTYLPQHADDALISQSPDEHATPVRFVFTGNIGVMQDVGCILEAVEILGTSLEFEVHFVGDGSYLETARRLVSARSLGDCVIFHGRHPAEEMPTFLGSADACLLTLKSDNLAGLTIPGKLQAYLAAGKPVVAAIDGPARSVIVDAQCGLSVPAGDVAALAGAMRDFIENRHQWEAWGVNARRYYEAHYTLDRFMGSLEQLLLGVSAR